MITDPALISQPEEIIMLRVTVENTTLVARTSKQGKPYQVQTAYVHTYDRQGPKRYPEEIKLFPLRDKDGNAVPYAPGEYEVAPHAFNVSNGFLELGFVELRPVLK